jgi:hypothetical protein
MITAVKEESICGIMEELIKSRVRKGFLERALKLILKG